MNETNKPKTEDLNLVIVPTRAIYSITPDLVETVRFHYEELPQEAIVELLDYLYME